MHRCSEIYIHGQIYASPEPRNSAQLSCMDRHYIFWFLWIDFRSMEISILLLVKIRDVMMFFFE